MGRLTIPGVDTATSVPERLCFKCGKNPIKKDHILCPGCRDRLSLQLANFWRTPMSGAAVQADNSGSPPASDGH